MNTPLTALATLSLGLVLTLAQPTAAIAQVAPATLCSPGQVPSFQFGFEELEQQLGPGMGQPLECEHADASSGDSLQRTSTGLSFYRARTNAPTWTDGDSHWAVVPGGLAYWRGVSVDPTADAVVLPPGVCDTLPGIATGILAAHGVEFACGAADAGGGAGPSPTSPAPENVKVNVNVNVHVNVTVNVTNVNVNVAKDGSKAIQTANQAPVEPPAGGSSN